MRNQLKIGTWMLAIAATANIAALADWPTFRGVGGNPAVPAADLPTEFSPTDSKNIAWKVSLPGRSVGGPIVVGGKVITSSSGGIDSKTISVTAVDAESGKVAWQQEVRATGRTFFYSTSANAAPTPVSDGKTVFAFYSSNDLIAIDLDGNLKWYRGLAYDFPKIGNDIGMSSSPVVAGPAVVVQIECQAEAFVMGLDRQTGKTLWRIERPKAANWASPVTATLPSGQEIVVLESGESLVAVDPADGKTVWEVDLPCQSIPSSTNVGNKLIVPGSNGLNVFEIGEKNAAPTKLWANNKINPGSGSAVAVGDTVYAVNSSVLVSANLTTGEEGWKLRLPNAGQIWATPVVAGDVAYIFAQEGGCFVVKLGKDKGEIVAQNDLGEAVYGTPAIEGNAIYVRSYDHLWKIAKP